MERLVRKEILERNIGNKKSELELRFNKGNQKDKIQSINKIDKTSSHMDFWNNVRN